jgi:opacity protein-like surface antigen
MRRLAISMCVFLCLPLMASAQSSGDVSSRGTVFGGYSLLHNNNNNFNGWDGQGTFNLTPNFGVTADISGNSRDLNGVSFLGFSAGTRQHQYNFLFGPTATAYFGKSSVFGHALFGAAHSNLSAGVSVPIVGGFSMPIDSANAFAMAFGGGVDIGVTPHFAIRAAQVDYIRTNFNSVDALASGLSTTAGNHQNSFRYSGGVVWRW